MKETEDICISLLAMSGVHEIGIKMFLSVKLAAERTIAVEIIVIQALKILRKQRQEYWKAAILNLLHRRFLWIIKN